MEIDTVINIHQQAHWLQNKRYKRTHALLLILMPVLYRTKTRDNNSWDDTWLHVRETEVDHIVGSVTRGTWPWYYYRDLHTVQITLVESSLFSIKHDSFNYRDQLGNVVLIEHMSCWSWLGLHRTYNYPRQWRIQDFPNWGVPTL